MRNENGIEMARLEFSHSVNRRPRPRHARAPKDKAKAKAGMWGGGGGKQVRQRFGLEGKN